MDFLDPRKSRAHKVRLMIGYGLVALAIGLGTIILVYAAYGYGINTKTGEVVQNGLLFLDSRPGGADIYLNNELKPSKTSARLVLPSGDYDIKLQKEGYRPWTRHFTLEEHTIERFVYPFLFPNEPVASQLKTYPSAPSLMSESPDRRWLLVQNPSAKTATFDEYDTQNLDSASSSLTIPNSVLTNYGATTSRLKEVEWSTDNKHVVLKHTNTTGSEFIIFDRDNPGRSVNINRLTKSSPIKVNLRDKKTDQLYVLGSGGTLQVINADNGTVNQTILKNVLDFKPYGVDLISYVTNTQTPKGKVQARIWAKGRNYLLREFSAGSKYLIDIAQFQSHYYYAAGSNTEKQVNVYKDPLSDILDARIGKAEALFALDVPNTQSIAFSTNTRFICTQSGSNFAVYDIEEQTRFKFDLKDAGLDGPLQWMDGHRLIGSAKNKVFITDFDATNQQSITPTAFSAGGGFFSNNYEHLLTTTAVKGSKSVVLQDVDMRAGVDLPKR